MPSAQHQSEQDPFNKPISLLEEMQRSLRTISFIPRPGSSCRRPGDRPQSRLMGWTNLRRQAITICTIRGKEAIVLMGKGALQELTIERGRIIALTNRYVNSGNNFVRKLTSLAVSKAVASIALKTGSRSERAPRVSRDNTHSLLSRLAATLISRPARRAGQSLLESYQ